jgi:Protein of unknown function (DUF2695)
MTLGVMTTEHRRWSEFEDRLGGPEGCDFREDADGEVRWKCSAHTREQAVAILRDMGISDADLLKTLDYFDAHGGYCDCEILLNVDARLPGDALGR